MGMPFCLLLWFHRKDEDLYNRIFIWKDLTVYPVTRTDACFFSASLLFLKWKWFCCAAYSLANGAQPQPLSRHWGWNISSVLERRKVLKFEKTRFASLSFSTSMSPCIEIHFCDFLRSGNEEPLAIWCWNPGFWKLSHILIWRSTGVSTRSTYVFYFMWLCSSKLYSNKK